MKASQKHHQHCHHTQKKRDRQRKNQKKRKTRRNQRKEEGRNLVFRLQKTISHYFPDLYERMATIPECRQDPDYSMIDILMAGLAMMLLKKGSRHAMNAERTEPIFRANYERIFHKRLPHMDTVNEVMKVLDPHEIERLKAELVKGLLVKKTLRKYRLFGTYYKVVIDGTHVMTVPEGHCSHCLHRTLKNGKILYFHTVVEAKLVGDNGFCLSLASEWLENEEEYDKQDCELKGFIRLAQTLKRTYPRLPICVVADGLYPNQTFFRICQEKGWPWIVTLKEGNLSTVWKAVLKRQGQTRCRSRHEDVRCRGKHVHRTYHWETHLTYQEFTVHWFECGEVVVHTYTRFVYLTNLDDVRYQTVVELTASGRMRWKIENEGFDVQKHHGYGLGHQFSQASMTAMENYYQLMQIAHLINQLFELGSLLAEVRRKKESLCQVWLCLVGELRHTVLEVAVLTAFLSRRIQVRYD